MPTESPSYYQAGHAYALANPTAKMVEACPWPKYTFARVAWCQGFSDAVAESSKPKQAIHQSHVTSKEQAQ